MRLIDADHFLNFIKEEMKQDRPDDMHLNNIIRVLKDLPTAYNVDKVVAELEEYANGNVCKRFHDSCPYKDEPNILCENCGALGAIDIVKRGGVE